MIHTPRASTIRGAVRYGTLVGFGIWLRRHDSASEVPEVMTILEKRFRPANRVSFDPAGVCYSRQ